MGFIYCTIGEKGKSKVSNPGGDGPRLRRLARSSKGENRTQNFTLNLALRLHRRGRVFYVECFWIAIWLAWTAATNDRVAIISSIISLKHYKLTNWYRVRLSWLSNQYVEKIPKVIKRARVRTNTKSLKSRKRESLSGIEERESRQFPHWQIEVYKCGVIMVARCPENP